MAWHGTRTAFRLIVCGIALIGWTRPAAAAEDRRQPAPPVPLYAAHVSNTMVVGDGMIVITTKDSLDTVVGWYGANLKDRVADVAVGPGHHHFLTRGNAGIDISAEGAGADAATRITLFWQPGGPSQSPPPSPQASNAAPPEPALAKVEPLSLSPLRAEPVGVQPALAKLPEIAAIKKAEGLPQSDPPAGSGQGLAFFRAGQYAEALLAWQQAAADGNASAALLVGMMYDAGQGVPQSYPDALSWYRLAADKGSSEAAYNIGVLYNAGFGVRQDAAEAAEWYERAAAKGSGRAAFNLALLYENGDGVPADQDLAGKYFRRAERQGVVAARSHVRSAVPIAASAGESDMPFNTLHVIESDAPKDGSANAVAAADRIQRLADTGDPAAQYDLGYYLENGIGVAMDLYGAYAMYLQAAAVTDDSRLKLVAEAGAGEVKAHLTGSRPKS